MGEKIVVDFRKLVEAPVLPVRAWVSNSSSRPGIQHLTWMLPDGSFICTCEGGQLANKCWHLDTAKKLTKG